MLALNLQVVLVVTLTLTSASDWALMALWGAYAPSVLAPLMPLIKML